jgi:hypothetical protein
MASAPSGPHRMPAPLRRRPITVLQAASIGPEPICRTLVLAFRKFGLGPVPGFG